MVLAGLLALATPYSPITRHAPGRLVSSFAVCGCHIPSAQVLITCSATMRGAKPVNLKAIADEGCEHAKAKGHEVRGGLGEPGHVTVAHDSVMHQNAKT